MRGHIFKNKINKWFTTALFIVAVYNLFSQTCESTNSCCNNVYFNTGYTVTFAPGYTTATVQFTTNIPKDCSGTAFSSINWDFGDATPTNTVSTFSPSHTYTLSGACNVYTISVCLFSRDKAITCNKTQVIYIQDPTTSFSNTITASSTGCKAYDLSYNGSPITNAQWAFGDGSYSSVITTGVQTISHTYPASGTYVVTLTGDGISPCFIMKQVVVTDFVTPDFGYTPNDVCNPSAGVVLNISDYNSPLYNYVFTINNHVVLPSAQTGSYTLYWVNGMNTVKLKITDPFTGCVTDVTKLIYLGSTPPDFTLSSQTICSGDGLSITGVAPGAGVYTWTITKPDNSVVTLTGINPLYIFNSGNTTLDAGTYTIGLQTSTDYLDPANSASTTSCANSSPAQTVTVLNLPDPAFTISQSGCAGAVTFNLPTTTFTTYTLNYGDGNTATGSGTYASGDLTHTYTSNGIFTAALTLDNSGCSMSYNKSINAGSLPLLTLNASQTNICSGGSGLITSQLSNIPSNAGTISYSWTGPAGFTSNQSAITFTDAGTYVLTVTSDGSCALNSSASLVIAGTASPSVTLISAGFADCTQATASATVEIPTALLIDGYCINGTCTAASPSASAPVQVIVTGLAEGHNYITVTNALNSTCSFVLLADAVKQNPVMSITSLVQPDNCSAPAGSANLSVSSPATTTWYSLANYPNTSFDTGTSVTGLSPGDYVAEAVDGTCVSKLYINILAPAINVSMPVTALGTCSANTVPGTVNAQFIPTSVTGTFTYEWQQIISGVPTTFASGSANTQNLVPGTYSVQVSSNGCVTGYNFTVSQYDPITVTFTSNSPNCKTQAQVEAKASGGDGNYSYAWQLNGVTSASVTPVLNLGYISAAVTTSVNVQDQSGCSGSNTVVISPSSPVTLQTCSVSGVGTSSATVITPCDISACVSGGTAPYTFEWFKVGTGTRIQEDSFYVSGGVFYASIPTNTAYVITVPSNSTTVLSANLMANTDQDPTTVYYPFWDFTGGTAVPVLKTNGKFYSVVESVTVAAQESLTGSCSGPSTSTTSAAAFTDGDYNLHVRDANGCSYTFTIGTLTFDAPSTFSVDIEYVFGIDEVDPPTVPDKDKEDDVLIDNIADAVNDILDEADKCMEQQTVSLKATLATNCTDIRNFNDAFNLEYVLKQHHYTLYYYDRAGQLTKTIPPEGVHLLSQTDIDVIKQKRTGGSSSSSWPATAHRLATQYNYNSFGQLLNQNTPDGSTSNFIYDSKNRLRFSQNQKQKYSVPEVFSYTKYDDLGRIMEVGESSHTGLDFVTLTQTSNTTSADNTTFPATGNKQITHTVYTDQTPVTYYGREQRFLQNRVSYTYIDEDPSVAGDEHYTYYSYDSHGNVEWLVQDNTNGIGKNYIAYDYDLVSGKVLKVSYNEDRLDRFFHKYQYDAENRLVKTLTSRDGELWDEDASYQYYAHGPLKRSVIGEDHVQGLDYIYTIQGWIKSINTPHLNKSDDEGKDGIITTGSTWQTTAVAADKNGMVLNYFDGDYKTSNANFLTASSSIGLAGLQSTYASDAPGLYNGNISSWSQSQVDVSGVPLAARADLYQYDVLNRIKQSTSIQQSAVNSTTWTAFGTGNNAYKSDYTYDANGNILTLNRYDNTGAVMDALAYTYSLQGTDLVFNRLMEVNDAHTSTAGMGDIEDTHTYLYDSIGNLVNEVGKERGPGGSLYDVTTDITWTVYGKIKEVNKTTVISGTVNHKLRITFAYDASGNRVEKRVWTDNGSYDEAEQPEEVTTTYYIRDAQGNSMATYTKYYDAAALTNPYKIELQEQSIYGSDRIGQNIDKVLIASAATSAALPVPANGPVSISEYENWITTTNKASLLNTNDALCQCRVKTVSTNNPTNPNYSLANTAVEFLGIANNGVAVAENLTGQLQFYTVLAKKYLGNNDACLIFDKDGNLMKGTELISVPDVSSKPVIVNIPGTDSYAVITLNTAKQPVYHIVDMSAVGYGPVTHAGEVVSVNMPVVNNSNVTATHGYHFTGVEDHITNKSIVYSTRYTPDAAQPNKGTTEIVAYDFGSSVTGLPYETVLYTIQGCGSTETGELQISPGGDKLTWYQHDKSISGFKYREGSIYTMALSPDWLSINGAADIKPISTAGNAGNGMLDFMPNNTDVLYSQRGLYKETTGFDKNVWKYEPLNTSVLAVNPNSSPLIGYLFGEIKRGTDGRLYIPNMGDPADKIHSYSGSSWNGDVTDADATAALYEMASALPTQVFKIFADPTQAVTEHKRSIRKKEYELKDHLGNVKMVITDAKLIASSDATIDDSDDLSPDIASYTDYYPFGSPMPNRQFNAGSYRYGFNGKEIEREGLSGVGSTYDYGYRIYNSSIAKFLSVDPLTFSFSELTPYQFASNTPIQSVDLDGLEALNHNWKKLQEHFRKGEVSDFNVLNSVLLLTHIHNNKQVATVVFEKNGPTQGQLLKAKNGDRWTIVYLAFAYPDVIANRDNFGKMYKITNGTAGIDFSLTWSFVDQFIGRFSVGKDEYSNSILHFYGQTLASSLFGYNFAKLAGDIHERGTDGAPETLFDKKFSEDDKDNWIDLINNEWGRMLGSKLRNELDINEKTKWTTELTANYFNKINKYLEETFNLKTNQKEYTKDDQFIIDYTKAINTIMETDK